MVVGAIYTSGYFDAPAENDIRGITAPVNSSTGEKLASLEIKGRAPKTGYERDLFSSAWAEIDGCDMRNYILQRDLTNILLDTDGCTVRSGQLKDPYTGKVINFVRGPETSDDVQIDHIVALSDAWQKGAQQLSDIKRYEFANDPINLQATDGPTNTQKGDSDAATWLPPDTSFRCSYVTKQIEVKTKYSLWITRSEYDAMNEVLSSCS